MSRVTQGEASHRERENDLCDVISLLLKYSYAEKAMLKSHRGGS
jgi:hypothetical protein